VTGAHETIHETSPSCIASLTLIVLFSLCVIAILAVAVVLVIPRRLHNFWTASSRLPTTQQLYLATLLILQEQSPSARLSHRFATPFRIGLGEPTARSSNAYLTMVSLPALMHSVITWLCGLDTSLQQEIIN
jgi:hypothetical protein